MRRQFLVRLILILLLGLLAGLIVWPNPTGLKGLDQYTLHQGLDLKGGTQLIYALKTDELPADQVSDAIESVRTVISQRVDSLGVSEPVVEPGRSGTTNVLNVSLPGISDIESAKALIGTTAKLEFQEIDAETGALKPTGLTGKNLKRAQVQFDEQTNAPQIGLIFDGEGAQLFAEITKRNLGQPVAILLDGKPITTPVVQSEISSGEAQITGQFTLSQAKNLAIALNAGALPVPVELIGQQTVGATLGADSVTSSVAAGLIGLLLVILFMVLYYGLVGLLAAVALGLYTLFMAALIEAIPITMSLAGIAGIILSIGMAVDANVLIFERMKEEQRAGASVRHAIDEGFRRAWQSIRDSNVSSLITAAILYFTTTGLVRGFAMTLALGILVSLFTAIFVTRTFLRLVLRERRGV